MKREFAPGRLDVLGFAADAATLAAEEPLSRYPRLLEELAAPTADAVVHWEATGQEIDGVDGKAEPWLHLVAEADVPLVCQRCLSPVEVPIAVDRWFRFVADEDTAAAQDDESEEDLLVISREFDLHELIEDELLMDIPMTPVHEVCPEPVRMSSSDEDFKAAESPEEHPFAALGALRSRKPGQAD